MVRARRRRRELNRILRAAAAPMLTSKRTRPASTANSIMPPRSMKSLDSPTVSVWGPARRQPRTWRDRRRHEQQLAVLGRLVGCQSFDRDRTAGDLLSLDHSVDGATERITAGDA